MTGEAYDHLMAVVVLGALFSMAVFIVPSLSYVNLLYLEQQQMRNIALSALKTVLFDEGYPANWGSMAGLNLFNESAVQRFGLALLSDPSFYVLDADKIQRLASNPMGNISYQKVKELLGLTGYDFSIVMRPLFNVKSTVNLGSGDTTRTISFKANVSRYDGKPVPNAIVWATIIYAVKDGSNYQTNTVTVRNVTDALGRCQGSQTVSVSGSAEIRDVIVIFRVTVADRATIVVSSQDTSNPNDIALINVVGDNIVLTMPPDAPGSQDARWITNIQMYNFETSMSLLNGSGTGNDNKLNYGSSNVWNASFPGLSSSEPGVLILTFRTETLGPGGRTLAILVGPYALWSQGGIMQFNTAPVSSGASMSVQRDVIILGMAYVAELRLWKT